MPAYCTAEIGAIDAALTNTPRYLGMEREVAPKIRILGGTVSEKVRLGERDGWWHHTPSRTDWGHGHFTVSSIRKR